MFFKRSARSADLTTRPNVGRLPAEADEPAAIGWRLDSQPPGLQVDQPSPGPAYSGDRRMKGAVFLFNFLKARPAGTPDSPQCHRNTPATAPLARRTRREAPTPAAADSPACRTAATRLTGLPLARRTRRGAPTPAAADSPACRTAATGPLAALPARRTRRGTKPPCSGFELACVAVSGLNWI